MTELSKRERRAFEKEVVEVLAKYHGLFHPEWKKRVVSVSGKVDWFFANEIYVLVNADLETLFKKKEQEKA